MSDSFLAHPCECGINSPSCTLNAQPCCQRSTQAVTEVSNFSAPVSAAVLHDPISDEELVAHIAECRVLMRLAQARFRGSHSPQDAAEAQEWSDAMDAGIKARQAAYTERDELTFDSPWALEMARRNG